MAWPPTTHQDVQDTVAALLAPFPMPQVGEWIHSPANNISNTGYPNGEADLGPTFLPGGSYDMVAFQVGTAGSTGAVTKVVVYSNVNGRPSALLVDTSTVDTTTTGVKQITLPSTLVIGSGGAVVWGGTVTQGAPATNPSIWTVSSFSAYPAVWSSPQFTASWPRAFVVTGITGAAPSTTATSTTSSAHARLAFHRSA